MRDKRITNQLVSGAEPTERDRFVWDRDLRGFGLKITAAGRKTYVVQYRLGGRGFATRRYTIGVHDSPWTATTARAEAQRILHLVGLGQDPAKIAKERTREQIDLRFDKFVDRFFGQFAASNWGERTFKTHRSNAERWLVPVLGSKPLPQISRRDVTEVLDRIPPSSPALPRNLFALMRGIFNWAIDRGDLEKSPMQGMRAPRQVPERHHILSDEELLSVAVYAFGLGPVWGNLIHLLILTGQRLREVAELEWDELDRAGETWSISRERTKNGRDHLVPLNKAAIAVLDELAGGPQWPSHGYVFSHQDGRPVSGFSKMKARFDRILELSPGPSIRPWRLHDLRRTVATNMQRLGVRFEVTEALLNHVSTVQAGVASVYQRHDWAAEKRAAMQAWGERLVSIIDEHQARQQPRA